jgi:CRP-like cAMP-binding protein
MVMADVRPEPVDVDSLTGHDDVLADVEIFAGLEPTTRRRIAAVSVPRRFRRGQLLFRQGEPEDSLIMLRDGAVVAFRSGPDGEQTVVNRFYAPEVIREVSFLDGLPRSMSAEAIDDVTVLTLSRGAFMDLVHSDPRVLGAVMRSFGALVRRLTEQDSDDVFLDLPGRLAKTLVRLAGGVPLAAIELNRRQLREKVNTAARRISRSAGSAQAAISDRTACGSVIVYGSSPGSSIHSHRHRSCWVQDEGYGRAAFGAAAHTWCAAGARADRSVDNEPRLGERGARESDAGGGTHGACRTVAADEPARGQATPVVEHHGDAVIVWFNGPHAAAGEHLDAANDAVSVAATAARAPHVRRGRYNGGGLLLSTAVLAEPSL